MGVGLEPTTSGLTGLIFYNLIAESVFFILHIYYNIFFYKNQIFLFIQTLFFSVPTRILFRHSPMVGEVGVAPTNHLGIGFTVHCIAVRV